MKTNKLTKMILAGLFIAIGFLLPFLTGQIPQIGSMLSPMHIPVLLCGFVCGPFWGALVGAITPLLRSLILGMPPLFPVATAMAFELAAYGFLAGLLYTILPKKPINVYVSLILAMLIGRVVWGLAMAILMGLSGGSFGFQAFLAGAFINAWPGILLHLIIIPPIVLALERAKFIPLKG
ncbi:MAG: ECF transporter S component [Clostridiales bacterium]|jgi:riboflavin transporter FmnP|nr:ECF transporter S component [Clostridiales bacterium]